MKIYNYHPTTGEFRGASEADKSPLEKGVYLIPAHATAIEPPPRGNNQVPVFTAGAWVLRPDFRGRAYYDTATGECHEISSIGEEPDPTWTDQVPGENTIWDGAAWAPDLPAIREKTWRRLEADLHRYIFVTRDYPEPTQISLISIYNDPDSNAAQRTACKQIFDWVKCAALPYYYAKKAEVLGSDTPEAVTWDFAANCDASAPGHTLAQIIQMQE